MLETDEPRPLRVVPTAAGTLALAALTAAVLWPRAGAVPGDPGRATPVPVATPVSRPDAVAEARARVRAVLARHETPAFADVAVLAGVTPSTDLDRIAAAGAFYDLGALDALRARHPGLAALETLHALAALATGDPALVPEARATLDAQHVREGLARELRADLDATASLAAWIARSSEVEEVPESELPRVRELADARDAFVRLVADSRCAGTRVVRAVASPLVASARAVVRSHALHLPAGEFLRRALHLALRPVPGDALQPELALALEGFKLDEEPVGTSEERRRALLAAATRDAQLASEVERDGQDPVVAAAGFCAAARRQCFALEIANDSEVSEREELARLADASLRLGARAQTAEDRAWVLAMEHDLERMRARLELGWAIQATLPAERTAFFEVALDDLHRALACIGRAGLPLRNRQAGTSREAIDVLLELGRVDEAQALVDVTEILDPLRADLLRLKHDLDGAIALASRRLTGGDEESLPISEALAVRALARAEKGDLAGAREDFLSLRPRDQSEMLPRLRAPAIERRIQEEASRRAGGR